MKKSFLIQVLLIILLCSNVVATPIQIPLSSFSGTETIIDFNTIDNAVPISNQYSAEGVIFTGALYGLTNPGDTIFFPNNGNGHIASNWIYPPSGSGLQGNSFTATFDNSNTKVGFYLELNGDDAFVTVSLSGSSSGLLTFNSLGQEAIFVGLEEPLGFDSITMTVAANETGFFAIDDFRFEGASISPPGPSPVPEPSTLLLLSIGIPALMGLRKKMIH